LPLEHANEASFFLRSYLLAHRSGSGSGWPSPSTAEKRIFEELNQERVNHSLRALEWNGHAADAARAHARLLAENGKLSHQFLGEAPLAERLGTTGARFTVAAETWPALNLSRTPSGPDGFIRASRQHPEYQL